MSRARVIIAAVVASVIGAATAVGIALRIIRPPPDAGLLEAIPGKPLHHAREHMPIVVVHTPDAYGWSANIEAACKWWNAQTRLTLFVYQGESPSADFTRSVSEGSPGIVSIAGRAVGDLRDAHTHLKYDYKGRIVAAPISVDLDAPSGLRERMVVHELGHVLGFDHDDELPQSVMHPVAGPGTFRLTGADLMRLLEWYGT